MDTDTHDIVESLHFIKDNMATRDELAEIRKEMATKSELAELRSDVEAGFRALGADIRDIRAQLDVLTENVAGMKGYAKEIDELHTRVVTLEAELEKLKQVSSA